MRILKKYYRFFIYLLLVASLAACASMGNPSGGERDLDPPKVQKSYPAFNQLNVSTNKIVLEFDENVTVSNPMEKVIITPPQRSMPRITAINKRLVIELRDTLIANTTYTIDFTDAVSDNNENNVLENFSFSFSTGDKLDSLLVSGKVLAANNLEPAKGMYVGLHSNLNDTAFTKIRFERISRTNESGDFTIRGVAPGRYRIYALEDANRDYMYDNPAEGIAFLDSIIVPVAEAAQRTDSIHTQGGDKAKTDSVEVVNYTRFLPDNILLRSFKSAFRRQYLQKHERVAQKLSLYFGAPTSMPKIELLNADATKDWALTEHTAKNDTIMLWVKDKDIMAMDTLALKVTYLKTDTLNQAVEVTDTLKFIDRTRKKVQKKKDKDDKEDDKIEFLPLKHNLSPILDVYRNVRFEFEEPIVSDSLQNKIKLQQIVDSTFHDRAYKLEKDTLNPRLYIMKYKWEYGNEYRISIDSAAIQGLYGRWNNKLQQKFRIKKEDEYSQLAIQVEGIDSIPAFVELLDDSDRPVRRATVRKGVALFNYLNPGKYYMRIVLDENGNGLWDTGDYEQKKQPEKVCYYKGYFDMRPYYQVVHDWKVDTSTMATQKPLDITKNKPKDKDTKLKEMDRRDAREQEALENSAANANEYSGIGNSNPNNVNNTNRIR